MENTNKNTPIPQSCKTVVMQSVMIEELLQKIKFVLSCGNDAQAERIIEQFVFYQEETTIEFARWFLRTRFDSSGKYLNKSDKELYDIFKRERSETVA